MPATRATSVCDRIRAAFSHHSGPWENSVTLQAPEPISDVTREFIEDAMRSVAELALVRVLNPFLAEVIAYEILLWQAGVDPS